MATSVKVSKVLKNQRVYALSADATVRDAARLMATAGIGAVLVKESGKLVGIFTERDLCIRVVSAGLPADTTPLKLVMSLNPDVIQADAKAYEALQLMHENGYRHLPVMNQNDVIGVISIRDLNSQIHQVLEEDLAACRAFIYDSYGAVPVPQTA